MDEGTVGEGVGRVYEGQPGNLKMEGTLRSEHTCHLSVSWGLRYQGDRPFLMGSLVSFDE